MRIIADTHVHIYPCYNLEQILDNLRQNLSALDPEATQLAFLAERNDCHFFAGIKGGKTQIRSARVEIERFDDAVLLKENGFPDLYIFPGRQIITRERIEILGLTTDGEIPDGLPASEVLEKVWANNGIPVVSWAPGKWFFQRKKVVQGLLQSNEAGSLLMGDTTLRPLGWLQPLLMKEARKRGFGVIAGSDPLPFAGEEKNAGLYATRLEADFDAAAPVTSIRKILSDVSTEFSLLGHRGNPISVLHRLFCNAQSKKHA